MAVSAAHDIGAGTDVVIFGNTGVSVACLRFGTAIMLQVGSGGRRTLMAAGTTAA